MRNIRLFKTIALVLGLSFFSQLQAQTQVNTKEENSPIDFKVTAANNHLWRGIEVTDGLVFTTDVSIADPSDHFRFGLWGGTNTSGTYKEFNYYGQFTSGGFSLALWDTYNFSPAATYNNTEFFNYKADETGRFLDATAKYNFGDKFPLTLQWSTVIFGRDRNVDNTRNLYSTYCYAEYQVYKKDIWQVDLGLGGTFAIDGNNDEANFYADEAGIIHGTLKVTRDVTIGDYTLPVHAQAIFNPVMNRAYFQLGATVFSF